MHSEKPALRHMHHSTGLSDVDDQHKAIDALIGLYRKASGLAEEQECLDVLLSAVQSHFQFAENYFDVKFPAEFKQRQAEILGWLTGRIAQRRAGDVSQTEFADELCRMFLLNAASQDCLLTRLN